MTATLSVSTSTWMDWAIRAAETVCLGVGIGGTFTADHIWLELERMGAPEPPDKRSMGGVINELRKAKIIRSAGIAKTERPERDGYLTVWEVIDL